MKITTFKRDTGTQSINGKSRLYLEIDEIIKERRVKSSASCLWRSGAEQAHSPTRSGSVEQEPAEEKDDPLIPQATNDFFGPTISLWAP
jgi:hypothetical protein